MNRHARTVTAVALVLTVAGCTRAPAARPPAHPSPPATSTPTMPSSPDDGGRPDDGVFQPSPAAPSLEARTVADGFARAWARPMLPQAQWHAGVAPYCSVPYADLLRTVDPARVPARTVTGPLTATTSTAVLVVWAVPTDAGTITVTTALLAKRWLVTTVAAPEASR